MGACLQFYRGCLSGAEIAPFRLWLPPPASLSLVGDGSVHSQLALLWYSLSPLLCEWARKCLRLGLFTGQFFFFSLCLAIPQFGLLSHISSLRLPSGHSGLALTLSNAARTFLFRPPACWWQSWVSGLVPCWKLLLGTQSVGFLSFFLSFFFLPVMLPSEIPKLPTDLPMRVFPSVGKLLLF